MRVRNLLFFVLLVTSAIAFNGCDKCNQDCFTPPRWYIFDIVDSETEENVFSSGIYNPNDVSVSDESGNWVKHEFKSYGDTNLLSLPEIGWNTGRNRYTISLNAETEINFTLEMQEVNEDCCTFFRVIDFGIENFSWAEVDSTGVIRVEIGG